MSNLYGVSNAPGLPVQLGGGNFVPDISCTPSVYTLVGSTPALVAPSSGYFYAMVWINSIMASGTTPPNNIFFGLSIGAGSISGVEGLNAIFWQPSEWLLLPWVGTTVPSQTAWQGAGSIVNIYVQPTGTAVTHRQNSGGYVALFRAPDQ